MGTESTPSLTVSLNGRPIFSSYGKWLHPLLELESFLSNPPGDLEIDPGALSVRDRIVGKAAALLILRLGIRRVHAETISYLGRSALEAAEAEVTFNRLVDRVLCATEELLIDVDDPEEAHRIILARIRNV
ncbi:MAG: DUF1893 domain-containing protein [Spirochaetota bacterium]